MIYLLTSAASEARLRAAAEFVLRYPPGSELTLIGPSRDAIDDFARANGGAGTFGWYRFTLPQLAKRLAATELASRGLARATAVGAEAVAARAAYLLHREKRLPYFAPVAESPGFARALASTLQELRMARVTPVDLRTDIMKVREYPALDDLSWLLERFEEQCRSAGIADWPAVLEAAQAEAEQEPARDPVLLLDLPIHTPSERAFLKSYLATAPEVLITLPEGDTLTRESAEMLGPFEVIDAAPSGASRLDRLRTFLFSTDTPPVTPDHDDVVTFFSAPGEGRECMEIARRILQCAKSGVPFDHMAVFVRWSAPAFRRISCVVRDVPIRRAAHFWRCSVALLSACRRGPSRNIFRCHKYRGHKRTAHRPPRRPNGSRRKICARMKRCRSFPSRCPRKTMNRRLMMTSSLASTEPCAPHGIGKNFWWKRQ
jgi:ATP-dependent helicase/nuclease subunit B